MEVFRLKARSKEQIELPKSGLIVVSGPSGCGKTSWINLHKTDSCAVVQWPVDYPVYKRLQGELAHGNRVFIESTSPGLLESDSMGSGLLAEQCAVLVFFKGLPDDS